MPPSEKANMSQEQLVEEHGKRLNVHAERLNEHDRTLSEHQRILGEVGLSLYGDARLNIKGLIESMKEVSESLREVLAWREEMIVYYRAARLAVRVGLTLLGLIVGGVWWPQISALLKLFGG